jgi:ABC-type cobalamin transport system permease subunit
VTLAGVAPDVDGLGVVIDLGHMAMGTGPSYYFQDYHHLYHCLGGALLTTLIFVAFARRRLLTAALVLASFHLHLLCDLVGSRGPDGYQWPMGYLQPFSDAVQLSWSGQWELNSWQNAVVTVTLIAVMMTLARRRGYSCLELLSSRADQELVTALRRRFPLEAPPEKEEP